MAEHIIYVAGNPNLYPIEYYDKSSDNFRGVIPELLEEFSLKSGYDIKYYKASSADRRKSLSENQQTDLISGCTADEKFANVKEKAITVLQTEKDGKKTAYNILLAKSAPAAFEQDLRKFFEGVSADAKTELLIRSQSAPAGYSSKGLQAGIAALAVAVFLLIVLVTTVIIKYRKKLKKYSAESPSDSVKGIGSKESLASAYRHALNDKNKNVFNLIYFYIEFYKKEELEFNEICDFSKKAAEVLQNYIESDDVLVKISDTEFAYLNLTRNKLEYNLLIGTTNRLRSLPERNDKSYYCNAGAGVYMINDDGGADIEKILFEARKAAVTACGDGVNYMICEDSDSEEEPENEYDIEKGIENKEFVLYIQYYINTNTFRNSGGEAMLIWKHPKKGQLSAERFYPVAKEKNMTNRINCLLLESICAFLEELDKGGVHSFFISCNFSDDAFANENFAAECIKIISNHRFDKRLLIFGFSPVNSSNNSEFIKKNIQILKDFGVQIMLEDFDDGVSNVYSLQKYEVNAIKLSKTLVEQADTEKGRNCLNTVFKISHELDIPLFAGGIKSDSQRYELQKTQCNMVQDIRVNYPITAYEAKKRLINKQKK